MKKILIILLFLFSFVVISGQDDPNFSIDDPPYEAPYDSSQYYSFGYFRIGSDPGGWENRNTFKLDSLFNASIVLVDTSQLFIRNDTLFISPNYVGGGPHGIFRYADSSYTLALTQNSEARITNDDNDLYSIDPVFTERFSISGDTLYNTLINTAELEIETHLSFGGGTAGIYEFYWKKNGDVIADYKGARATSNADVGSCSFITAVEITSSDILTLWVKNTGSNTDYTAIHSQISLQQKH